jgi:xanthine dehydrogenase accessory factor
MRELCPAIEAWIDRRTPFVLATVVAAGQPAPRGIGALMAIAPDTGQFIGSVSAGCVENAVIEMASAVARDHQSRWERYGGESGFPWELALTCGGRITVRTDVFPADAPASTALLSLLKTDNPGIWLCLNGKATLFQKTQPPVGDKWDSVTENLANEMLTAGPAIQEIDTPQGKALAYRIEPPRRLFIVGAAHTSLHLIPLAQSLLYKSILIDPRQAYLQPERLFSPPDQVHPAWPNTVLKKLAPGPLDAAAVLSHDPKIDDAALEALLHSDVGYIGALGSRKSHMARLKRLRKMGFDDSQLKRIHAPIGIPIRSHTPAQIAISIAAQLVESHLAPQGSAHHT